MTTKTPLTAEQYAKAFGKKILDLGDGYISYKELGKLFEAYAAQQNAELVDRLETETARSILLGSFNQRLKSENERLKQQLVGFRNAAQKALSQPAEYIDLLNMFHDTQPPKEAT